MASYTTNLNLKKPAGSENVAIGDINNNMDAIDQAYGTMSGQISIRSLTPSEGDITISSNVNVVAQFLVSKTGKLVVAQCIGFTATEDINAWSTLMSLASAHRPLNDVFVPIIGSTNYIQITTSGNVIPSATIASGSTIRCAPAVWRTA